MTRYTFIATPAIFSIKGLKTGCKVYRKKKEEKQESKNMVYEVQCGEVKRKSYKHWQGKEVEAIL